MKMGPLVVENEHLPFVPFGTRGQVVEFASGFGSWKRCLTTPAALEAHVLQERRGKFSDQQGSLGFFSCRMIYDKLS